MRALLDQLDCDLAHRGVVLVLQHLESIDDGANRADYVVADAGAEQSREVRGFEHEGCHCGHPVIIRAANRGTATILADSRSVGDRSARPAVALEGSLEKMPQVLPLRDLVIPSKLLDVIAAALARAALAAGPAVM